MPNSSSLYNSDSSLPSIINPSRSFHIRTLLLISIGSPGYSCINHYLGYEALSTGLVHSIHDFYCGNPVNETLHAQLRPLPCDTHCLPGQYSNSSQSSLPCSTLSYHTRIYPLFQTPLTIFRWVVQG